MTQRVEVRYANGTSGYAYAWHGTPPLEVGDEVLVPGPYWGDVPTQTATVTSTTTKYEGRVSNIIRKV